MKTNELVDKNAITKSMYEKAAVSGAKKTSQREVGSELTKEREPCTTVRVNRYVGR